MARELHDIAAHHLSGMIVQASAADRLIDRDPEAARTAVQWIRAQGKLTLANLRLVVGVLRESAADQGDDSGAPVPGLGAIGDLLEATRALGVTIELDERGHPSPLSPVADVTVYRVLQESLSNARQHAPGRPITVRLEHTPNELRLRVENAAIGDTVDPAANRGLGLVGMRERAQLIGARFTSERSGSVWRVSLDVPIDDSADSNEWKTE